MLSLQLPGIRHVALLGAHCDDLAIGAGGSLLTLCAGRPDLTVHALVLGGGGTAREDEERAALADFCAPARLELTVLDFPDGRMPAHWLEVKEAVAALRGRLDADLVLAPHRGDRHQDHRLVAEIVPQVFRDQLVLGYEILKWDGDLAQPAVYQPLTEQVARRKAELLAEHYPSQHGKDWYDEEAFLGLARLRGVQQHTRYAEAFHVEKLSLALG
ncbi:PIG-L family deacetylase [Amycolatopsis acidiphila]|uniref:PIG-L family deacetylase n=1 Tax=Amycolatopsis acidiphila TaxID=715473 RepID=A0A558AKA5_9PSEU|nr:PIG-L family deacetylase [Amycolatopsis acidiphila]TVT24700.1 PIG-L family deacetylase [Amycolatopsis acidiphila]UIJ62666.1 PIG-L family deacetylase [Amycolatopsis acidiphila]GHG63489.1 GlcNAc-PI de-N-acetylase [Amycolatopsis acidiphila]